MTPKPHLSSDTPVIGRVLAMAAILAVCFAVGIQLWLSRLEETRHAELLVSSMTQALAQQIGGSVRSIDGLLTEMSGVVLQGQWATEAQHQRFSGRLEAFPEIRWIGFVTPQGKLLPDTIPAIGVPPEGLDVSDREYFRVHLGNASPELHVGQPVFGRATQTRTLHLSLGVFDGTGTLMGEVVAAVNPDYYAAMLDKVLLDPQGGSGLYRADGLILARAPHYTENFGRDIANSPLFRTALPAARSGVAHITAVTDGNRKFLGYQAIDQFGLVVSSGVSEAQAMASWGNQLIVELTMTVAFGLAVFLWARQADLREGSLLRHRAGLEEAVKERTAALTASTQLAERRSRQLTHLAQVTAHNLQEPVRPIVSFTQLARRELKGQNPEADEMLGFVEKGGKQLKAILEDFHRYTTILGERARVEKVDLDQALQRIGAGFEEEVRRLGGMVTLHHLPTVSADLKLLTVALSELIENAVKFRHPERRLRVDIDGGTTASGWWLSVADNGRGLSDHARPRLFEAFARLNPDDPASVGLGLALCNEAVKIHGGTIDVESTPSGSRFTITVPFEPAGDGAGYAANPEGTDAAA